MSRGRLPLDKIWDLDMVRSIKDALRQLSNPGLDVTTDVFSYQVKQIQLNADSPSEVNQEGAVVCEGGGVLIFFMVGKEIPGGSVPRWFSRHWEMGFIIDLF